MNPGDRRKNGEQPPVHRKGREEMSWGVASGGQCRFKNKGGRKEKNQQDFGYRQKQDWKCNSSHKAHRIVKDLPSSSSSRHTPGMRASSSSICGLYGGFRCEI